jgi:hypothetical protein
MKAGKRTLRVVACVLCLVAASQNADATVVPYNANGFDLVHSSVSNVSWLKNGNLLGSWIAARGVDAVFNDIVATVPTITLTLGFTPQVHNVVRGDFDGWWGANGGTTFYGAYAFIQYLNAISYAGTNQWRLPNADNGVYPNPLLTTYTKAGDFGQLYYDELNSPQGFGMEDPLGYFDGEVQAQYWSSRIFPGTNIVQPFGFNVGQGRQDFLNPDLPMYVWPVTSGTITAVPESGAWVLIVTSGTTIAAVQAFAGASIRAHVALSPLDDVPPR